MDVSPFLKKVLKVRVNCIKKLFLNFWGFFFRKLLPSIDNHFRLCVCFVLLVFFHDSLDFLFFFILWNYDISFYLFIQHIRLLRLFLHLSEFHFIGLDIVYIPFTWKCAVIDLEAKVEMKSFILFVLNRAVHVVNAELPLRILY